MAYDDTIDTSNAENAISRLDAQLDRLEGRMARIGGSGANGGQNGGIFGQLVPELSGFSTVLESRIGTALDRLIVKGGNFSDVIAGLNNSLLNAATQLSVINPLLNAGFGAGRSTTRSRIDNGGSGLFSSLAGGIGDLFSGWFGGGAASTTNNTGNVTVNIQTPNAQSFSASQGQVSAAISDAVQRGMTLR